MAAAILALDSPNITIMGPIDARDDLHLAAGEADTFFRGAIALLKGDGAGLTVVHAAASSDKWGGLVVSKNVAAVADRVHVYRRCLVRINNLDVAITNAYDFEGKPFYADFNRASDNPKDLVVTAPDANDGIQVGIGVEWISTTSVIVDLGNLATPNKT